VAPGCGRHNPWSSAAKRMNQQAPRGGRPNSTRYAETGLARAFGNLLALRVIHTIHQAMMHHRSYQIRYTGESRCLRQKWIPVFAGKAQRGRRRCPTRTQSGRAPGWHGGLQPFIEALLHRFVASAAKSAANRPHWLQSCRSARERRDRPSPTPTSPCFACFIRSRSGVTNSLIENPWPAHSCYRSRQ
jgi:hypothetical protein